MGVYSIIMAGGSGTRFWPVSRYNYPKQCINITGDNSMVKEAVERLIPIIDYKNIYIVTGYHLYNAIKKDLPDANFILEPMPKNTAPCIGLSILHILCKDPEAIVVIETADHYYKDEKLYHKHILAGVRYTTTHDKICLIGIKPSYPATGYGYIQLGTIIEDNEIQIYSVQQFVEKPCIDDAKKYIVSGTYLWNSGIFIAKARVILDEISKYMPGLYAGLKKLYPVLQQKNNPSIQNITKEIFENIPVNEVTSIDFGVIEKSEKVVVIKGMFPWYDVGSWKAIEELHPKDKNENIIKEAEYIEIDSKNNIIYSTSGKLITTIGINNTIIVDTQDAILICAKDRAEEVKNIVEKLKKDKNKIKYL